MSLARVRTLGLRVFLFAITVVGLVVSSGAGDSYSG